MRRGSCLPIALLVLAATAAAGPRFRFERTVQPGGPGPNRLDPDVALLTGAVPGSFADLRLFDAAGREVPWLLVQPEERRPEWRPGKLLPVAATKKESGFEVDLGSVLPLDRLRLEGLAAPFLKRFRLEGGGDRSHWTLLVPDGTLFDLPDEQLTRTEVAFPAGEYRYLRLTWDDRSSAVSRLPEAAAAQVARRADPPPLVRVPLAVQRRESEPGKSRFRLRLPGKGLPVVALELVVGGGHLLRRAEVSEGRLDEGAVIPLSLGRGTLRRQVRGELAAADLRLEIDPPAGPELDLVTEDGDNPPLDLQGASAELAPLPWIYLETSGAGPLTARYGDPRAAAPQYDLEAVRPSLAKLRPALAHWGPAGGQLSAEAAAGPAATLPTTGAPLASERFRWSRPIPQSPPGLTSLGLDAAVLAGSRDLADLRIADARGRQVPYLVERRDEPLPLPLTLGARAEQGGSSRYRLELPYELLPEARVVLTTSARVFERRVRLLGANPRQRRPEPLLLADKLWQHADPETAPPALVLPIPTLREQGLDLVIEEGDNAPLPLGPPRLLLPTRRVRFFHPGGELRLLYGQPGLAAPRYDLALLAPRLLGEAARESALAAETGSAGEKDGEGLPRKAFWGVLALAVVALLFLLGRLLRENRSQA